MGGYRGPRVAKAAEACQTDERGRAEDTGTRVRSKRPLQWHAVRFRDTAAIDCRHADGECSDR